jgi:peptide deformylase
MSKITTDLNILRAQNGNASVKEANDIVKKLEVSLQESETEGVGLAAPQIGINKRVAIVRAGTENIDLVNPTIVEKEDGFVNFGEGCLSIPGERLNTQRYKQIFVVDDLRPNGFVAVGDVAIVIQHEVDHLDGILITDRVVGKEKIGRNDKCPCGSGLKYKRCHGR